MINYSYFEKFNETAIIFSNGLSQIARKVYNEYSLKISKNILFLINKNNIICSATFDKYESYIIIGIECPLHPFENRICYTIEFSDNEWNKIIQFNGFVICDSSILNEKRIKEIEQHNKQYKKANETQIMVVSKNQTFFDYFNYNFTNVEKFYNEIIVKDRIKYLMKENMNANIIKNKKMFGIIYTSKYFESTCNELYRKLNKLGRAYKIFLKDISYERLISIENIDCIIIIDCPINNHEIRVHIPIVSPFSVSCFIKNEWTDNYNKNWICKDEKVIKIKEETINSKELKIISNAGEFLIKKEYQGVQYRSQDEDMEIHSGKSGIASKYLTENKNS